MMQKIRIKTEEGNIVEASAPVIISASRSTDIPAFYSKWFIKSLKRGYIVWINPFNRKPLYVSFKNTRAIVFWTKNPKPILEHLKEIDKLGINYYFQYTVNDYEKENLEPNLASLKQRIYTFKQLSNQIGVEKIIWRFDPILMIPSLNIGPREILFKIWDLTHSLNFLTNKLVFSFVDVEPYKKVKNNLIKSKLFTKDNIQLAEPNESQRIEIVEGLAKIRDFLEKKGWSLSIATCAERFDYQKYGIEHNRCIDGELLYKLFSNDLKLKEYLESFRQVPKQTDLFDCSTSDSNCSSLNLNLMKDKGQRIDCGCTESKDIGMYNTCIHNCIYCYANSSKEIALKNRKLHRETESSIIPFTLV